MALKVLPAVTCYTQACWDGQNDTLMPHIKLFGKHDKNLSRVTLQQYSCGIHVHYHHHRSKHSTQYISSWSGYHGALESVYSVDSTCVCCACMRV